MMRLCYLILAAATHAVPLVARTRDEYAHFWSREFDKGRCDAHACSWMGGFGAIDVGCEFVVDRAGLTDGSAPAFSLVYNDGERLTVDARDASLTTRFKTRPALCEYGNNNATSDVAFLMVANAPAYVFRLWGPILNKLLYATDAGLRPMLWIGDLPRALRTPESQCLQSREIVSYNETIRLRNGKFTTRGAHALHSTSTSSFYNGHVPKAGECSNHYIKMPATLAALAAPGINGVYFVDLDAVVRYPWTVDPAALSEHRNGYSDVSFLVREDWLRWQVKGSRFYARDSKRGRNFFAAWFRHRCTFKDQYSLWHTILKFAAAEGCVPYNGEIYQMLYHEAKTVEDAPPALKLDCAAVDAKCPSFPYSNVGGDKCDGRPPNLLDDIRHHSIGGDKFFRLELSDYHHLTVQNACFATDDKHCEYASSVKQYATWLGIDNRDPSKHAWNASVPRAETVGVCVVLTHRDRSKSYRTGLGELATLMASLAGQGVRRCLVSDTAKPGGPAAAAAALRRIDARAVVDDWFDAKTAAEVTAAEPTLITNFNRDHAGSVLHRMTRFLAYAEVPYDVTLYLDDDMYVCPGEPLGPLLLQQARRGGPVQLAERWLAQGSGNPNSEESRRAARWLFEGRPPRFFRSTNESNFSFKYLFGRSRRGFDLQGGAVLLVKSPTQKRWARAARQAYVDLWAVVRDKSHVARTVHDQPALNLAAARFGDVHALPTNYNFRVSSRCEDAAHLVRGPVRVVHHHEMTAATAKGLCQKINARTGARAVVGVCPATLRDGRIELQDLAEGSPWLTGAVGGSSGGEPTVGVTSGDYCSPVTARYMTLLQRDADRDVLVFHKGQGFIARDRKTPCKPSYRDREAVQHMPFDERTWLSDALAAPSLRLPARALHNYAVAATPSGFVALGGGTIGAGHSMTEDSWVVLVHKERWEDAWSTPVPLFGPRHEGCIDRRPGGGGSTRAFCEYDGRLSLAPVNASHFRVYARANMKSHGGRHVVTALCSHRACEPFSLVEIDGYERRGSSNIYFFCVEFFEGGFIGYAPVVEDGDAYIGLSTSRDGVAWTAFARVASSQRDVDSQSKHNYRYRTLDQPVCGTLWREGRIMLYVQREVPGIFAPHQDCCRKPATSLEKIDVTQWVRLKQRSAPADASKRDMWRPVLAELDRSLDRLAEALPPVDGDQASWLARTLHHWDSGSSILVLEGRAYVSERFAGGPNLMVDSAKNMRHLAFLSTMHRPCPNSAYNFYEAATGHVKGLARQHDESHFLPPLVMAKRDGYDMLGLLVPNPYFAERSNALEWWARNLEQIYARVAQRPFESRIPRVFWRGVIRNHPLEGGCALEAGNEARLQAATLSYAYPDAVDVKCTTVTECHVATEPCPGRPRDEHEMATAANAWLISAGSNTPKENYTMYKYVLNLPGSTSGSYSRNLNHLWSLDSVVMLWRDTVKEWYYPALEHGVTHLDVDKFDLVKAVQSLEADPSLASKLRKGAKRVEYAFTTPESLADYLIEVLRRAGQRFFSDVLDDACTARDFFATRVDCKELCRNQNFTARSSRRPPRHRRLPGRWRGDAGSSPLDRHGLISTQAKS